MPNASENLYIADVKWEEGTDLALADKEVLGINLRIVNISLWSIGLKVWARLDWKIPFPSAEVRGKIGDFETSRSGSKHVFFLLMFWGIKLGKSYVCPRTEFSFGVFFNRG